jgi:threonine/homoserine/homoserine lactone efflux protein
VIVEDGLYSADVPALSSLPVFVAASLVLLLIPGPAVLFIVARSGAQGTRAGLVSVLGVHAATVVHVLAAVAGLSAVVVASSIAFTGVKLVGGLYLIFLGVKSLRSARQRPTVSAPPVWPEKRLFAEAFVVSLLNPKVALFFLAFLPQFVVRGHGPIWSQTLVLGLVYIALGLCSDSMYAVLGAHVGTKLSTRAARLRATRYAEGGILVGLGVLTLALPHRRTTK